MIHSLSSSTAAGAGAAAAPTGAGTAAAKPTAAAAAAAAAVGVIGPIGRVPAPAGKRTGARRWRTAPRPAAPGGRIKPARAIHGVSSPSGEKGADQKDDAKHQNADNGNDGHQGAPYQPATGNDKRPPIKTREFSCPFAAGNCHLIMGFVPVRQRAKQLFHCHIILAVVKRLPKIGVQILVDLVVGKVVLYTEALNQPPFPLKRGKKQLHAIVPVGVTHAVLVKQRLGRLIRRYPI